MVNILQNTLENWKNPDARLPTDVRSGCFSYKKIIRAV